MSSRRLPLVHMSQTKVENRFLFVATDRWVSIFPSQRSVCFRVVAGCIPLSSESMSRGRSQPVLGDGQWERTAVWPSRSLGNWKAPIDVIFSLHFIPQILKMTKFQGSFLLIRKCLMTKKSKRWCGIVGSLRRQGSCRVCSGNHGTILPLTGDCSLWSLLSRATAFCPFSALAC